MKKFLVTGLLVWVPLGITLWVLNLTITTMDQTLLLLPEHWRPDWLLGFHIPGLGIILTFVVVLTTGLLIRNVFGQRLWEASEKGMLHIPFEQGQDRYSTEVVLQGFNGVLTMLDSRSGGMPAGMQEGGQSDYGASDDYGGGSGGGYGDSGGRKPAPRSGGGGKPFDKKIDDEIPF